MRELLSRTGVSDNFGGVEHFERSNPARLHHAVLLPQQLPQIPVFPARHPDLRETIFEQQTQDQLRILAIRLLFAYSLGSDLSGVPQSTTHSSVPLGVAQTSAPVHWLPSPRALSVRRQRDCGRTPPLPQDAPAAALVVPQSRYPHTQSQLQGVTQQGFQAV